MKATEIAKVEGVELVQEGQGEVFRVEFDSRRVQPGDLFVALVGQNSDGHRFVSMAVDRGASALLVSQDVDAPEHVSVLKVGDTRERLGLIAAKIYGHPSQNLKLIGITGTNGKTTSAAMVETLLASAGHVVGVFGTINIRWKNEVIPSINTTPESSEIQAILARMLADGVTHVVMEVSSHGLATHRLNGCAFDVGVFTNLTQDHLDFHGTFEAYEDAKALLFERYLPDSKRNGKVPAAVINSRDAAGMRLLDRVPDGVEILEFGTERGLRAEGSDFHYQLNGHPAFEGLHVEFRVPGEFNVENALGASLAVWACGVPAESIAHSWTQIRPPCGRLEEVVPGVYVDYAHTPDALERALRALRSVTENRLIVVFGCGGDRDREKRPLMGRVAEEFSDLVIVTSDNPRTESPEEIMAEIAQGFTDERTQKLLIAKRREAIAQALVERANGDIVLIAGKGHETYQEIGKERVHFSDHEVVREFLEGK